MLFKGSALAGSAGFQKLQDRQIQTTNTRITRIVSVMMPNRISETSYRQPATPTGSAGWIFIGLKLILLGTHFCQISRAKTTSGGFTAVCITGFGFQDGVSVFGAPESPAETTLRIVHLMIPMRVYPQ